MHRKPLIGLSPSYYEHKEMDRSILGKSYTDRVQEAGGLPVLIPPIIDPVDLGALIARLDGIILTGGDDLDPVLYGEAPGALTPKPFHPRRGLHDRQIFDYVWTHKVPTLAICLGMQEVNVFLGGSLHQDIPTCNPEAGVHKIGDWFEARHTVSLEPDSQLAMIVGRSEIETNSAHHQAVHRLADPLRRVGLAADGIIEAIEPRDRDIPLVAVQWHPESETNEAAGLRLFQWLIKTAGEADHADL